VLSVGHRYYAYSMNSRYGAKTLHVPVRSSTGGTAEWGDAHDALPELPVWVDNAGAGQGSVWTPAVTATGHGGYLLYFTARSASQHTHCIGVARARATEGPFHPIGARPLVCRVGDVNVVDPKPFTETDGANYLLYGASREGNDTVWLQQLTADGTETIGDRRALIQAYRADEDHIVEAPAMIRHGGTYVLFYSGL
jgi:arabinan endo-1,5-alpha-L-arabinosidase